MPSPQETKRLIEEIIGTNGRTNGAALSRSTDKLTVDAKMNMVHYRVQLESDLQLVASVDAAAKGGGAAIMTIPAGYFSVLGSRIEGSLTTDVADLTSTAGELGLGTTVATGAVAVLGGTAGFENILEGGQPALGNFTAGNDLAVKHGDGAREPIGAFSGASTVYLNCASTWADIASAANVSAKEGMIIEIWGILIEA